jgi:hypothetical protein
VAAVSTAVHGSLRTSIGAGTIEPPVLPTS